MDVQERVLAMLAEGKPISQGMVELEQSHEQNDALDAVITSLHDQGFVECEKGEWHATETAHIGRVTDCVCAHQRWRVILSSPRMLQAVCCRIGSRAI